MWFCKFDNTRTHRIPFGISGLQQAVPYLNSASSTLRSLSLVRCQLGDAGASIIAELLPVLQLAELNLSGNEIGADGASAICAPLVSDTTLTELVLDHNPIGDRGAEQVADVFGRQSTLIFVSLRDCDVTVFLLDALLSANPASGGTKKLEKLSLILSGNLDLQYPSQSYCRDTDTAGLRLRRFIP